MLLIKAASMIFIHSIDLNHNGIRLDNICFIDAVSMDVQVVMIFQALILEVVCMYNCPQSIVWSGKQNDFMQLSWIAAWVMDPSEKRCHNMNSFTRSVGML